MSTFVTELFWAEEKQSEAPLPGAPRDLKDDKVQKQPEPAMPAAAPENQAERLQRVAGNAALARQAEEAEAAMRQVTEAARQPAKAPAGQVVAEAKKEPLRKADEKSDGKAPPAEKKKAAEKRVAAQTAAATAKGLPESVKAAAARSSKLNAVLAAFERTPGDADLLGLAQLVEDAPPEIAEGTARALAKAAMRADPDRRAAIAWRVKEQLGSRRDLRLTQLLADRLAWASPPRAAPAPPPPPPPPEA